MTETKMVEILVPSQLLGDLDELIEEHGGTHSDWVQLSVIAGLWESGYYSKAFDLYRKAAFDSSDLLQYTENMFIVKLKEMEEKS